MYPATEKSGKKSPKLRLSNDSQVLLFPGHPPHQGDDEKAHLRRRSSYWPKKDEILQGPVARIANILKTMKANFILLVKSTQDAPTTPARLSSDFHDRRKSARHSVAFCSGLLQDFTDNGRLDINLINFILEDFERCVNALKIFERKSSGELSIKKTLNALKLKRRLAKVDTPYVSKYLNEMLELGSQAEIVKNRGRRETQSCVERQAVSNMHVGDITQMLDHYGTKVPFSAEINKELDLVNTWDVDIFKIHQVTSGMPLTCVTYRILQDRALFQAFNIPPRVMVNFLSKIESKYHNVPYHCSLHGADVVQSSHILLSAANVNATELETLSMVLACAVHDVDHPGFNNQYMINTENPLAELYKGSSVLENNSVHVWLRVLTERDCDIMMNMSRTDRNRIKAMVKDLVMATDMANHVSVITDMKSLSDKKFKLEKFNEITSFEQHYALRIPMFCGIIHCCDLANPTKPLSLYNLWVERIKTEFFNQGDQERIRLLKISPMCDRETVDFNKCQVGFIDYVVLPIWSAVATYCSPDLSKMMLLMSSNRGHYAGRNAQKVVDDDKRLSDQQAKGGEVLRNNKTQKEPGAVRDHESSTIIRTANRRSIIDLEFEEKVTQSIVSILRSNSVRSNSVASSHYPEEQDDSASASFVFPEAEVISLYCSYDVVDEPPKPKPIPFDWMSGSSKTNSVISSSAQGGAGRSSIASDKTTSSKYSSAESSSKRRDRKIAAWNRRNSLSERDRIITQEEACQLQKRQMKPVKASEPVKASGWEEIVGAKPADTTKLSTEEPSSSTIPSHKKRGPKKHAN